MRSRAGCIVSFPASLGQMAWNSIVGHADACNSSIAAGAGRRISGMENIAYTCVWTGKASSPKEEWYPRWVDNMMQAKKHHQDLICIVHVDHPHSNYQIGNTVFHLGKGQLAEVEWMNDNGFEYKVFYLTPNGPWHQLGSECWTFLEEAIQKCNVRGPIVSRIDPEIASKLAGLTADGPWESTSRSLVYGDEAIELRRLNEEEGGTLLPNHALRIDGTSLTWLNTNDIFGRKVKNATIPIERTSKASFKFQIEGRNGPKMIQGTVSMDDRGFDHPQMTFNVGGDRLSPIDYNDLGRRFRHPSTWTRT